MSASYEGNHNDYRDSTFNGPFINEQYVYPLPSPPEWPLLVGEIPQAARHYQQRSISIDLHHALAIQPSVALRQTTPGVGTGSVVSGMGGVGKTQLAAAYVHRVLTNSRAQTNDHTAEYPGRIIGDAPDTEENGKRVQLGEETTADLVMWVNASTRTTIIDAYAREASAILQRPFDNLEKAAQAFVGWLTTTDKKWLIVFDDLVLLQPPHPDGSPTILNDLWPPTTGNGRLLITTRDSGRELTERTGTVLDLGVYTEQEADNFLTEALTDAHIPHTLRERTNLSELLGRLPLALNLVVAYLADRPGMTISVYIDLFTARSQTLERMFPRQAAGYAHTIATTWALSIDHANQQTPHGLARPLAGILSLLDSDHIPLPVLIAPPTRAHLVQSQGTPEPTTIITSYAHEHDDSDLPPGPPALATSGAAPNIINAKENGSGVVEQDVRDVLVLLNRLNLITLSGNLYQISSTVTMHQLVQRAIREDQTTCPTRENVHATADALLQVWPEVERDLGIGDRLRAHTRALRTRTVEGRSVEGWLWQPHVHPVLFWAGSSLGNAGRVGEAVTYWEKMAHTAQQYLGLDHPHTLTSHANLAYWRGQAGDVAGAATFYEELLPEILRIFGPDHPNTLLARSNLAHWWGETGDAAGATTALKDLLTDQIRILGPDDPNTFSTRNNLAALRGRSGDPAGAIEAYEELLTEMTRILGPAHPDTLLTRNNLAYMRGDAGDLAGAVIAYGELLPEMLRALGPDHPHTLATHHNLARWRGQAGDLAEAITVYENLLADLLQVLGPDHPHTLMTRNNLASLRGRAGDTAGAVSAFDELFTKRLRVFGPGHPDTLTTRLNLACWRGEAGDVAEAVAALERLLADQLRILGPDHPDTLTTRAHLARWLNEAGDLSGAIATYERLLAERLRVLGSDHPNTLITRANLANMQGRSGDPTGAVVAYEKLLTELLGVLHPDHPDILTIRSNLTEWTYKSGDVVTAIRLRAALTRDQKRVHGPNHPETQDSVKLLQHWRNEIFEE